MAYNEQDDDVDNMIIKLKIFQGKFSSPTQALSLVFDNNESSAVALRSLCNLDETETALTFAIKCLPDAKQSDLEDFTDFLSALVKTSGILDEADFPVNSIAPSIVDGLSFGEKLFRVTCPLKPEISGIAVGVIQAAGVNHVDLQLKIYEKNQAAMVAIDLDVSRNAIELAQEMAGLPPELASFAQMYNESDMTFKFKSWDHLAGNQVIGELIPKEFAEEVQSVLSGSGLDTLAKKFSQEMLNELVTKEDNGIFGPLFAKAMACFLEVQDVQFVVGNTVF